MRLTYRTDPNREVSVSLHPCYLCMYKLEHIVVLTAVCCPGNPLSLVDLVPLLQKTLKDDSSVTCKMACCAVRVSWIWLIVGSLWSVCVLMMMLFIYVCVQHCIMTLCSSTLSELGLQLVIDLFALRDCSYWLVRTELLETLADLDFR